MNIEKIIICEYCNTRIEDIEIIAKTEVRLVWNSKDNFYEVREYYFNFSEVACFVCPNCRRENSFDI